MKLFKGDVFGYRLDGKIQMIPISNDAFYKYFARVLAMSFVSITFVHLNVLNKNSAQKYTFVHSPPNLSFWNQYGMGIWGF